MKHMINGAELLDSEIAEAKRHVDAWWAAIPLPQEAKDRLRQRMEGAICEAASQEIWSEGTSGGAALGRLIKG